MAIVVVAFLQRTNMVRPSSQRVSNVVYCAGVCLPDERWRESKPDCEARKTISGDAVKAVHDGSASLYHQGTISLGRTGAVPRAQEKLRTYGTFNLTTLRGEILRFLKFPISILEPTSFHMPKT